MSEHTIPMGLTVPVRHTVDVLVAGGGPAGIAAAIAARRQGVSVLLIEGHSCFGGMGTAGLVPSFCQFGDGVNLLAGGIGGEVLRRLDQAGGLGPCKPSQPLSASVPVRAEVLKRVYDEMVTEAGVEFVFCTHLIGVQMTGRRIDVALAWAKSGLFAVRAHVYVDCTGDADLCAWAGAPYEKGNGDGMMPGTLCSLWANVDFEALKASGLHQRSRLEDAFMDHVFTRPDPHMPGMNNQGGGIGGGNIGHVFDVDNTDETSVTRSLVWGRKLLGEYERYYKHYLKGFEKMDLVATGSLLGIRETRRIVGDYVLTLVDFQRRATFEDEIGRYAYPVDMHRNKTDRESYSQFLNEYETFRYAKGESYGIPYRTLIPRQVDNVLAAGRCVSTDRYMQSSIRVTPGCFITGQAAGVAAGIAAAKKIDTRSVPVAQVQENLRLLGAYLPRA